MLREFNFPENDTMTIDYLTAREIFPFVLGCLTACPWKYLKKIAKNVAIFTRRQSDIIFFSLTMGEQLTIWQQMHMTQDMAPVT